MNKNEFKNKFNFFFKDQDQELPTDGLKLDEGTNLALCGGENVNIPTQNVSFHSEQIINLPIASNSSDQIQVITKEIVEVGEVGKKKLGIDSISDEILENVGSIEENNLVLCGGDCVSIPTQNVSSHIDQINLPITPPDDFDYTPIIEELTDESDSESIDDTKLDKWCKLEDRRLFEGRVNGNNAKFLDDTGCDGMIIGKNYALKHKLKIIPCESHNVSLADGMTTISLNEECIINIQIGKWKKHKVRFSVGNIDEDVILGIPFRQSIIVFNDDWINHKFEFITRSGTRHKWYGCGSSIRLHNHRALFMIKQDDFMRQFNDNEEEVFAINLQQRDELPALSGFSLFSIANSEFTPKQQVENFLNTITEPKLKGILEGYINNVFLEPCGISETPHRPEDMKINIKEGSNLRNQPLRRYSAKEDEMIKAKLDELLEKGWIQPSSSNYGTNLLFAKKKDGGYRMCIDYRAINDATIPDRTPLPSHTDLREKVKGAKYLSKLDIRDAFHMIRIDAPDCHKTAFKTRFGLFEYTVCPFGLTNSPATFMRMMNRLFGDLIDKFACYYVDDMMIYSSTYDDHLLHIKEVFDRLRDNTLHVKLSKCQFAVQELEFCGMHISPQGYRICYPQIEAMCNYPTFDPKVDTPKKYTQRFMGSVRFFADFVPCLAELAKPLFDLTTKQNNDTWNVNHQSIMRIIQFMLSTSPTLYFFDPKLETKVHTDASKYAIGGWLGQVQSDGIERVITYWSRKMISAELNYPVHEQEFLALFSFVKKFRQYLHGVPFEAYVDHKAMEHLQTQQHLSPRQVRWIQYLQEFMPSIHYIDGPSNTFADWLSRRPDYESLQCPSCNFIIQTKGGMDLQKDKNSKKISSISSNISANWDDDYLRQLLESQKLDPFCLDLENWLLNPLTIPGSKVGYFKSFTKNEHGIWVYKNGAIVIPIGPMRLSLLEHFHDRPDHGHQGVKKTFEMMIRSVYWTTMYHNLTTFIKSCPECQRTKPKVNYGLLKPLAIPDSRFESINIDFAEFPSSIDGFNSCLIIKDRFTKYVEMIPTIKSIDALGTATLLYKNWYLKGFGYPKTIVSDRDPRFISDVWKEFTKLCGISLAMSTSRHQQTDGGAEVSVRIEKQTLKKLVSHHQDDWTLYLREIQFAFNNSINSMTGFTPFYLAFGIQTITYPNFKLDSTTLLSKFQTYQKDVERAQEQINHRQDQMMCDYDKKHSLPPLYEVGDLVLLDREGLRWSPEQSVSVKLLQPYIGPFPITKVDSDKGNVTLQLPFAMKCHNEFHVSRVRPWIQPDDSFPGRACPDNPLPEIDEMGEENYEVEKIIDTRVVGRWKKRQFLVRWKGYDRSHDTWESVEELVGCKDVLLEYLEKRPIAGFSIVAAFGS